MSKLDTSTADVRSRDLLLAGLTFSSGAIDTISFISLGKVFTAFMTGNIAFFGMGLVGAGGPGAIPVLVAMVAFSVGIFGGTLIVKPKGPKAQGVWPGRATLTIGLSLLWHLGFLILWFAVGGQPSAQVQLYLISAWGVAMGMQSVAVRLLHVDGIYTTAATATFIFVISDLATRSQTPEERGRLWGVLISLLLGSIAGGMLLVHAHIYAPVLSFVTTLLVVAAAVIIFRPRQGGRSDGGRAAPVHPGTSETRSV